MSSPCFIATNLATRERGCKTKNMYTILIIKNLWRLWMSTSSPGLRTKRQNNKESIVLCYVAMCSGHQQMRKGASHE